MLMPALQAQRPAHALMPAAQRGPVVRLFPGIGSEMTAAYVAFTRGNAADVVGYFGTMSTSGRRSRPHG
jgi:hypothetical protein